MKKDKPELTQTKGPEPLKPALKAMDGNEATSLIAYTLNDISFIYPITPATPMGEFVDAWAAAGKKNIFGNVMQVTEMESELGVAGALHGALAAGGLATTFTSSQGLLLMIPNMYKIAGELMPAVLHVAARALAGQALSIFGDHSDVMAARQTGWAMLSSHSVQEAHDMALVAHLATLEASVPFMHFFDGFRTSHEINSISTIDPKDIKPLLNEDTIRQHRQRALNPLHPHQRGTSQGPDIYFQMVEAANKYHLAVPGIVKKVMKQVGDVTGRHYNLVDYVGHPQAERVIVVMGSGALIVEEVVRRQAEEGEKVGVIKVRLYRPWPKEEFLAALPATTARITVLDRVKEPGAIGDPLYLDVCTTLMEAGLAKKVVAGRYGLGSKEFSPAMVVSVLDNMAALEPRNHFTVGIVDDVTHMSLPVGPELYTGPEGTTQCVFWGMGSDGTVGANKEAIKIIADATPLHAQAYFAYDAHKSGGVTTSHLRFGPSPLTSSYLVQDGMADYVAVHNQSYLLKYDFLASLKPGGVLVLNTAWDDKDLDKWLPLPVKRKLAELRPQVYAIDAGHVANEVGLGRRINMVMQTVFFHLSGVLPLDQAIPLLKQSIKKAYGKKGDEVVQQNWRAVDGSIERLRRVAIPAAWGTALQGQQVPPEPAIKAKTPKLQYVTDVVMPMLAMKGDKLPVSVFTPGGMLPPGTTQFEKRTIAAAVPAWKADNCTQCNICSFVCPHAAIRPALALQAELAGQPAGFETRPAKGGAKLAGYQYRVQVSPQDCTGCQLCVHGCPDDALVMQPIDQMMAAENVNWDFALTLPNHGDLFDKATVKGSQFQAPLLEFSGACEGCGETPYVKLLTQLFGDRMVIANATGCSSIWGGSNPSNPYTTTADGRGPAWANSLFEDNAQFGFGIAMATLQRRDNLAADVREVLTDESAPAPEPLRSALSRWLEVKDDSDTCAPAVKEVEAQLAPLAESHPILGKLWEHRDMLPKISTWIVGGDGWAYDIGYGGLDHVLASGANVNILVLDTEMYSNTGGQKSKATPLGAVTKFAAGGKTRQKKDLCRIAMQYGDVYVASCCLDANLGQVVKAMSEAEKYPGVSLVVAYAPCAMHGLCGGMECAVEEAKLAVDSGYWELYRFDPRIDTSEGKSQLQLDSKRIKADVNDFLHHEQRFTQLDRKAPETATRLHHQLDEFIHKRHDYLTELAKAHPPKTLDPPSN